MAWGTKKKLYYDTDYVATSKDNWSLLTLLALFRNIWWFIWLINMWVIFIKEGKLQEELEAEEREEEEEAKNIQNRLTANLTEEDYDLSFFQVFILLKKKKPKKQKNKS